MKYFESDKQTKVPVVVQGIVATDYLKKLFLSF